MIMALKAIPQQDFQKCFQQWWHRWTKLHSCSWGVLWRQILSV